MKNFIKGVTFAMSFALSANGIAETISKNEYKLQEKNIEADYRLSKNACDSVSGNDKDICLAKASGKKNVAKAELNQSYEPSSKNRYAVNMAKAESNYSIAIEKCDDMAGNDKDVCVKEAKAARTYETADAKVKTETLKANAEANEESTEANAKARKKAGDAYTDANEDKIDADFAVAKEKCDALAGSAKTVCVDQAKVKFGK